MLSRDQSSVRDDANRKIFKTVFHKSINHSVVVLGAKRSNGRASEVSTAVSDLNRVAKPTSFRERCLDTVRGAGERLGMREFHGELRSFMVR